MTQSDQWADQKTMVTSAVPASALPLKLRQGNDAPKQLFFRSRSDTDYETLMSRPRVAIVGSRRVSAYGNAITRRFASELAARGVVIISGLAIGVDALAHRAALEVGGLTMAVLPSPVEDPCPHSHQQLANDILHAQGALISEYPADMPAMIHHFVERNRIVTGLADILLITEATANSGTTRTATYALGQGMDVLAVPGDINSPTSVGTNNLIKTGATPVTDIGDIIYVLNQRRNSDIPSTEQRVRIRGDNQQEQRIIDLIEQGISDGNQLLTASGMSVEIFNQNLTMLEITTKIRSLGANHWSLA